MSPMAVVPRGRPRAVKSLSSLSRRWFPLVLVLLSTGCAQVEGVREGAVVREWGGDLMGAGGSVVADQSVEGDAMLAGGEVRFTGSAGGDYLGAGGRLSIGGEVGGNMRAAGGDVTVTARVGQNATLAGGAVRIGNEAVLTGNGYLAGGLVEVEGAVNGHLRATGGDVLVNGPVGGDLNVEAGRLRIGPAASIGGDLHHRVDPEQVEIDPAAEIAGEVVSLPPRARAVPIGWWGLRLLWGLGFLLAGAVLVALFPGTALGASRTMEGRPGASAGLGFLWLLGVPAVAGVVFLTVIGIPLSLVLVAAFLLLVYLSRIVPAVWIGQRILRVEDPGRGHAVGAFLLGGVLLVLAGLLPFVGFLVALAATLLGIGAILLALYRPRAAPSPRPDTA